MNLRKTSSVWCAALLIAALSAGLIFAAQAVALPTPGQGYGTLPAGWVLQSYWEESEPVHWLSFIDVNHGWALMGLGNDLMKTTDGGVDWTDLHPSGWNVGVNAISFATNNVGWAVGGSDTIYVTADGGSTWTTQTTDPSGGDFNAVQAVDQNNVWAVGNPTLIFETTNGGSAWTTATINGYQTGSGGLDGLFMSSATQGVAVGWDSDQDGLILDMGSNRQWSEATLSPQQPVSHRFEGVWFTKTNNSVNGWAVTNYDYGHDNPAQVWFTTDHGLNWSTTPAASNVTTQDPRAIVMLSDMHGYIGCEPTVDNQRPPTLLETTDGGQTWTGFDPIPPEDNPYDSMIYSFASPDPQHLWAGGAWDYDPSAVWAFQTSASGPTPTPKPTIRQLLAAPVIVPQFPKTPFTVEDHDWLKAVGALSPKHKPGTYSLSVVCEKRVGKKWVVKKVFKAKLSKSGWTYLAKIKFPNPGNWRIRAVHGSGKSKVVSGYGYYKVIVDDWDIP